MKFNVYTKTCKYAVLINIVVKTNKQVYIIIIYLYRDVGIRYASANIFKSFYKLS